MNQQIQSQVILGLIPCYVNFFLVNIYLGTSCEPGTLGDTKEHKVWFLLLITFFLLKNQDTK